MKRYIILTIITAVIVLASCKGDGATVTEETPSEVKQTRLQTTTEAETTGTEVVEVKLGINGNNAEEYSIVYASDADKMTVYAARMISEKIEKTTGVRIPLKVDKRVKEGYEITVGSTNRTQQNYAGNEYSVYSDGSDIFVGGDKHAIVRSAEELLGMINDENGKYVLNVTNENVVKSNKKSYPDIEGLPVHTAALCDQLNAKLVLVDLDNPDPTSKEAIVWEWQPTVKLGFKMTSSTYGNRIDDAVFRYSEVLGCYVVCVTSSSGYICVAKYPSGECVWEGNAKGYGPHSIDYLPDGNIAVVCSGNSDTENGCIRIYTSSVSRTSMKYVSQKFVSAHGVVWDDENSLLWVMGGTDLKAYRVEGTSKQPELVPITSLSSKMSVTGGHNLSVCREDKDCLWISGSAVVKYNKFTGRYIADYENKVFVDMKSTKSVDSFEDGTVIVCHATNVYASHDTDCLYVTRKGENGKYKRYEYKFADRAFYKARCVTVK